MRRIRPVVLLGALYLFLSAAITWPLVLHLGSLVANDLGDPLLNMRILAWNAGTLPLTERWWNMPQFFPAPGATAFSEHLLGLAPITTPLLLATGNPVLAYNVALFLSFPLSALAGHALGWSLTRRHDVAAIAGLAFAFAPYRMAQLAHVQVESSYWMPLALVGLVRYFGGDRRWRWLLLFAGAWLMQALTCGYYFFYLSVLVGLWLAWFVVGRKPWADLARVVGVWAVAVAAIAPILYGYWRIQGMYGMRRWPNEIAGFSADVASLLKAAPALWIWGRLNVFDRPESELFPGLSILVLILGGALLGGQAIAAGRRRLRIVPLLVVAAIVFLIVAPTPILFGSWKVEIGGVTLLSVGTPHKPLSVAFVLLIAAAALSPTARALWVRRSPLAFFLIAAFAMWLMALGPAPTLMNQPILYKAPYTWLMSIPGVEGVRVPARFWMIAVLCLAAAGSLAAARLSVRWPHRRRAFVLAACVGILAEGWPRPLNMPAPPGRRPNRTGAVARLDLPITEGHDLKALYWGIFHRRPLVNGYSGYFAPHYWVLRYLVEQGDHEVLTAMARFGDLEVVVDREEDVDERLQQFVASHPAAEFIHAGDVSASYRIRPTALAWSHQRIEGATIPIAAADATVGAHLLPRMTDGDLVSRWDGRRGQQPGDSLTIDLGSPRQVRGVELDLAGYVADFPRRLKIETSTDGVAWAERWTGSGGGAALAGALLDARLMPLFFELDARPARYIRLTQLGSDRVFYWSIAELKVFGS
jgi:F5/8 type C domain